MIYNLHKKLEIACGLTEAWEFFSNPNNLKEITPPSLNMQISTKVNGPIYPGMIITYKFNPFPIIPMTWVTEITHVEEKKLFVDEQRYGPYRMWHHQHLFHETNKGVVVEDIVDYIMPLGPIGSIAHLLFVHNQLKHIFDFRKEYLIKRFGVVN